MADQRVLTRRGSGASLTPAEMFTRRLGAMKEERRPYELINDEILAYIQPRREYYYADNKNGLQYGQDVYDGSPGHAASIFARGMQGYSASPSIEWFKLRTKRYQLMRLPGVREWLEECDEGLYAAFSNSNFYSSIAEYFMDVATIGTATMHIEENLDTRKLRFTTIHPKEAYIAENQFGLVDTVYRTFEMSAIQAVERFGDDGDKLNDELLDDADDPKSMDTMYEFLHVCQPNTLRVYGKIGNNDMPYLSAYIQLGTDDVGGSRIIRKKGYRENPYAVWRWSKNSSELYGRSPAHNAIIDVIKLNRLGKDYMDATQLQIKPPMMGPASHMGRLQLGPEGINYYKDFQKEEIKPILTTMNLPLALEYVQDVRDQIQKHYHVDFFLMLAQGDANTNMTATEILERKTEKAAMLGPYIAIMNTECFNVIIDRVFQIEYDAGRLPVVPEILAEFGGERIDPEYMGPLAKAQKELFEVAGITRAMEVAGPLMEVWPETMDKIKKDETVERLLLARGFPASLLRSDTDIKTIRVKRQKEMARAKALQEAELEADMAQKMKGAPEKGSPLELVMEKQEK